MKKAAIITAVSKYINIFLGIFFSAILSRILTPNDYGIVAIITVFTTFFVVLSNCGLGIAVVQRKNFSQDDIDTLFSFSVYQGLCLTVIFMLLSFPISFFFNDKVYIPICLILSVSIFFNTINAVPDGILRKEKKFFLIAMRLVIITIFTYGITILVALLGLKYFSLVIQSVVSSLLIFLWNIKNVKIHFHFRLNYSVLKNISGYSGYNFLFNFVNYFTRNIDKIFIGKILGNENLAQYNKAYHFMLYPVQNLTNVITPVLHPFLSDFQTNTDIVYGKYIKIVKLLSLIGVFVSAICFTCSKEIILILYGSQWTSAVVCFHYLSLAIWTQMIGGTAGSVFVAVGDTKRMFFSSCISVCIIIFTLFLSKTFNSIEKISLCVMLALNVIFVQNYVFLIKKSLKRKFSGFLKHLIPDAVIFISCLFSGGVANRKLFIDQIFLSAIVKTIIISVVYISLLILFNQVNYFLPIVPKKWRNKIEKKHC